MKRFVFFLATCFSMMIFSLPAEEDPENDFVHRVEHIAYEYSGGDTVTAHIILSCGAEWSGVEWKVKWNIGYDNTNSEEILDSWKKGDEIYITADKTNEGIILRNVSQDNNFVYAHIDGKSMMMLPTIKELKSSKFLNIPWKHDIYLSHENEIPETVWNRLILSPELWKVGHKVIVSHRSKNEYSMVNLSLEWPEAKGHRKKVNVDKCEK